MSEQFDEYSKHLATTHSRRGLLKFLGAGFIGAAASTMLSKQADASRPAGGSGVQQATPYINQGHSFYWPPQFNAIRPPNLPNINATLPRLPEINALLPPQTDPELRNFLVRLFQRLRN